MRNIAYLTCFGIATISCFQMIQNINVNEDMAFGYGGLWILFILLGSFVKTSGKKKGDK